MTDLHTHILPCVDDGCGSYDIAISMLEEEKAQGVTRVVLTPHLRGRYNMPDDAVRAAFAEFASDPRVRGGRRRTLPRQRNRRKDSARRGKQKSDDSR